MNRSAAAVGDVRETLAFVSECVARLWPSARATAIEPLRGDASSRAYSRVTLAGDHLFVPLRRETARRAFKPAVAACRIVPGELVGTAGVYGAAKTFLDA